MAKDKVNYTDAASVAQALKFQIRSGVHWDDLTPAEKESLDQIATSIARMVSNDGVHWDAIIGFAHAAKPGPDAPAADLERGMRALVRELPQRNGNAT